METRAKEVKTLLSLMKKIKGKLSMKDYFSAVKTVYGDREYLEWMYKIFMDKNSTHNIGGGK